MNLSRKRKHPFDLYLPGSKTYPPRYFATIEVEVEERYGETWLTVESREKIDRLRRREMIRAGMLPAVHTGPS
ncbi:MAG: hypothetical protein JJU00_01945 [Opitutales bacterium]|nr:hypothetical protein [Opitutales bacterium]